jgi:hypothetical protein
MSIERAVESAAQRLAGPPRQLNLGGRTTIEVQRVLNLSLLLPVRARWTISFLWQAANSPVIVSSPPDSDR